MIIERDLLEQLGIMLDFKNGLIHWDHVQVEMPDMDNLLGFNDLHYTTGIPEPTATAEAIKRVSQILDAKYAPVSPEQILKNSPHLTDAQMQTLTPIFKKILNCLMAL